MMKRWLAGLLLAAMIALMSGCGMILVEDPVPVRIGRTESDRRLTQRC